MAYTKVNNTTHANLTKINNVPKATIAKVNNVGAPASGATLWVAGIVDCFAGFATTDLTSWTTYDSRSTSATPDFTRVGYGKDGSGDGIWVGTWLADNAEVSYTSDPTDSAVWTAVQNDSGGSNLRNRKHALKWGNNVWVAIGAQSGSYKNYFRSTDGQAWTQVDCSGYTSFDTTKITALTTDGAGTWWFAQTCRIYKSTNNASSFSLYHTISGCGEIDDLAYTNSTLVALANGVAYTEVAANSSADFSTGTDTGGSGLKRMAAANGRVVCVNGKAARYFDVSGKTVSNLDTSDDYPQVDGSDITGQCIGTDGTTWLVGCIGGHIVRSTDNGETWAVIVSDLSSGGAVEDIEDIKPNIYLPL